MTPFHRCSPRARCRLATPQTRHLTLLDAFVGYVSTLLMHDPARRPPAALFRRPFHTYFVTHLPSSSLHPDSRQQLTVPHHKLPRSASTPHTPAGPAGGSAGPLPALSTATAAGTAPRQLVPGRDLTVVRIPLRSAKHHFGVASGRGMRPYNEDTYQAGTIDMPAFAKRGPISLSRAALESARRTGEGITADGQAGDPQIFYFGIFDGHGGSECSDFLRDELAGYMEKAAADFGLTSSLRRKARRATAEEVRAATTAPEPEKTAEPDKTALAVELQRRLLEEYRDTIGGYFRRFRPACFADGVGPPPRHATPSSPPRPASASTTPPVTVDSVLTYAFLRADLDFVTAQANKPDPDDPCVADEPLNQDEILGSPHLPPSGLRIGGPARFKGGSTASVVLVSTPTPLPYWHPAARASLLVAHVGDTRVLLCETATGLARPLTRDHHPSSPLEARRLTRFAESSLAMDSFGEERISGLANSRAFGDMLSKRIGVSAEPELERVDLGPAQHAFAVLVSDGVSATLSDQEIVDVVKEARTPDQAARDVVDYATEVSRDGDNATCLVVRLGGWERRSEGGLGALGTKEIRDARRKEAQDPRRGRQ